MAKNGYVIIEDEMSGAEVLHRFCENYLKDWIFEGQAQSVEEGIKLLNEKQPALVFLDIEIRGGTGFDILDHTDRKYHVVFTTGYNQYAIKAIKYGAFDYLLKPLQMEEFSELCTRIIDHLPNDKPLPYYNPISDNFTRITLLNKGVRENIPVSDLVLLEAQGKYTNIHIQGGRSIVSSYNLGYYEELLSGKGFLRIHHGTLVQMSRIRQFNQKAMLVLLDDGKELPVSQRKVKAVKEFMQ